MHIELNGEPFECREGFTVADLLKQLQLENKRVAVERNLEIVPRSEHANTLVHADDCIEVVQAIGGG